MLTELFVLRSIFRNYAILQQAKTHTDVSDPEKPSSFISQANPVRLIIDLIMSKRIK